MQRKAECSCGALSLQCEGEPELVSLCHCRSCQRRTGAPYGIAVFFPAENVSVSGDYKSFERPSRSGFNVRFHFCPTCGATVFWEPLRKPGQIAVAYGAFADPDLPVPSQEVFTEHRHPWVSPL